MAAQIDSTPALYFLLNIGSLGTVGQFKEVSGLDSETEVIEDKKVLVADRDEARGRRLR